MRGQIQKAVSGFYYIYANGQIYQTRGRGNFRKRKITPLVGDQVIFESENVREGYLLEILPRKNELSRPPVANIDQAVIVISLVEPDFSYFLLDRFLVSLEYEKIRPIIYLSKADLVDNKSLIDTIVSVYGTIYPVIISNEEKMQGKIRALFCDKLTVFMGQSGAGKSTLLNEVAPQLDLATGEISNALGRGRHTTRQVELLSIAEGLVADTPGFSAINFTEITATELGRQFPEIAAAAPHCRFRECLHLNEPDCEVKRRVKANAIAQSRYDNYCYFLTEIQKRKPIYKKRK